MRRYSTYDYALDNPIRFIDKDGMGPNDPNAGIDKDVSETFKYNKGSKTKGTDYISSITTVYYSQTNKDGTTTESIYMTTTTATVDSKGKVGKEATVTTNKETATYTTNDKDCPHC